MLVQISSYQILMHICTGWCTFETIPLFSSKFKSASFGDWRKPNFHVVLHILVCDKIFTVLTVFKSGSDKKILKSLKGRLQAFGFAPDIPMYNAAITLYFLSRLAFHISHPLFAYECPPPIYWYIDAHLTPDPRFSEKNSNSRGQFFRLLIASKYDVNAHMQKLSKITTSEVCW